DDHELPLGHLPPLDELVRLDVALVHRAPALLLDRRPALAVEQPERHVGLTGSRLRRRREADRNVHEPEAHRSVPRSAHEPSSLPWDVRVSTCPSVFLQARRSIRSSTLEAWQEPGRSRTSGGMRSWPIMPIRPTFTRWTASGGK